MIKKGFKKLVGLKKEEFDYFVGTKQIKVQPARLIPALKTGDEMALSSIFLSSVKLVKEYRDTIFKEPAASLCLCSPDWFARAYRVSPIRKLSVNTK